jgi:hypothetical protein
MNGLYLLCFAIATILFRSDALPLVGVDGNRDGSFAALVANNIAASGDYKVRVAHQRR